MDKLIAEIRAEQEKLRAHLDALAELALDQARQLETERGVARVREAYIRQLEAERGNLRREAALQLARQGTQRPGRA